MNRFKLLLGPALGITVLILLLYSGEPPIIAKTAMVIVWMACWWVFEAISIYITAFLPVFLFPFLGIMSMNQVAPLYVSQVTFLFIGGFLLAFAMERWNLHKRIALKIILLLGNSPARLLLGVMLASYLLSMIMLNTAVVTLLLPAILAIITRISPEFEQNNNIATPLLLGTAFAASIGGTSTLVGTFPNMVLMDFFNTHFQQYQPITFVNWATFGIPISFIFMLLTFYILYRAFIKRYDGPRLDISYCRAAYKELGKISYEEKVIITALALTILGWIFLRDIKIGDVIIKGWVNLLPHSMFIKESTVTMLTASSLFLIPSKNDKGDAILSWNEARNIPVGIVLLFGGGFALAGGVEHSGLSDWAAQRLTIMSSFPIMFVVVLLALFMTFFTEITSNSASIILVLPIIAAIAKTIDVNPLVLMLPVTLSASYAFMLPVATPPNTLVFSSDRLKAYDMARIGVILNFVGVALVSLACFTIGQLIFNYKL